MGTNQKDKIIFTLMDLGLKKAGSVQLYDEESLDKNGNIIPFDTQIALVTHYLHNIGTPFEQTYVDKAGRFIDLWTNNKSVMSRFESMNSGESVALQFSLFDEVTNSPFPPPTIPSFTFIDLFAGIGGFRMAMQNNGGKCVFSSEWNSFAQKTYFANYGEVPFGDITQEFTKSLIPNGFDILCAGFPCQPFSIAGVSKKKSLGRETGFKDKTQGTLFFDVADIISRKRPKAFFLENVKNLMSHDKGNTFKVIKSTLEELGYSLHVKILDGKHYVPQHRERIFLVGFNKDLYHGQEVFTFPDPQDTPFKIRDILQEEVDDKYTLSDKLWGFLQDYAAKHKEKGNGFGYGLVDLDGISRTLSARYYKDGSEVLIPQGPGKNPRRLTPKECGRLMGYPENFILNAVSDVQAYRQCGNSVIMPLIQAIGAEIVKTILSYEQEP